MDDSALVLAAQGGSADAFGELVRRVQYALVACARQLTRSDADAEDLAQDALLEAYRCLPTLREPDKFRAWLFSILRYKCLTHLRQRHPGDVPLDDVAEVLAAPLPADRAGLLALLDALPQPDREVLAARYLQGLDFADIAAILGTSEHAVRMRVSRARAKLRLLADAEDDARTGQAFTVLLAIPLDAFHNRVLTEVSTMTQLASTAPGTAATATAAHFTLPALLAGAAGKFLAAVALVAALGGGYVFAGTRGMVPLPPVVAGAVGVDSATQYPTGSREAKMQYMLNKTLKWIDAHEGRLPTREEWPEQVGLTIDDVLPPDRETQYILVWASPNSRIRSVDDLRALGSDKDLQATQGRIPLLMENDRMTGGPTITHPGEILVGFLDGTVDWVKVPEDSDHAANPPQTDCISNLKQLALITLMLADDLGERFPTVEQWAQLRAGETLRLANGRSMAPLPHEILICPEHGAADSYAYNRAAAGVEMGSVREPDNLVLFYEVSDGKPDFRHEGGTMICAFADGHVERMRPEKFKQYNVR